MGKRQSVILIAIFVLSFLLRVYKLPNFPPSLNWDEVSHGYNAYAILKSGSDEWGKFLPLDNFRAYGDYPLPVSLYLIIPSLLSFGLNALAIRLPTALLGGLIVVSQYFLAYFSTKNSKISLMSAILIGIIPWTILPSRGVFQSTIALFFTVSSIAFLLGSKTKPILLPLSVLFLGLSAYSYHTARIVSVLLAPFFTIYILKETFRNAHISRLVSGLSFAVGLIFFVPIVFILISPEGHARANWVFLVDQGAVAKIEQQRVSSNLPETFKRIFYNRVNYFVSTSAKNYLGYFSPQFLFARGGTQFQFSLPGWGLIYWTLLPFVYGGLVFGVWKAFKGNPEFRVLTALLFLGPVPAAVTIGEFHVLRSSLMIPSLLILTSSFLITFLKSIKSRKKLYHVSVFVIFLPIVISLNLYLNELFTTYSKTYSWSWQFGYKEVVQTLKNNYDQYDRFIITKKYGEPHEFLLFFWAWDPTAYRNDLNLDRYFRSEWYWVDRFDKFYFVNDWEIKDQEETLRIPGKTLLITSPNNYLSGEKIQTINFLDGKPAFDIVKL